MIVHVFVAQTRIDLTLLWNRKEVVISSDFLHFSCNQSSRVTIDYISSRDFAKIAEDCQILKRAGFIGAKDSLAKVILHLGFRWHHRETYAHSILS